MLLGIGIVSGLDQRAQAEADLQQIESMGTDSYATLRSLFLQQREADIRGDEPVRIQDLPSFDDDAPVSAAPAPVQAPAATDPGVAAPSAARVPAAAPQGVPDAEYFLTAPAPATPPAAGPPIQL